MTMTFEGTLFEQYSVHILGTLWVRDGRCDK